VGTIMVIDNLTILEEAVNTFRSNERNRVKLEILLEETLTMKDNEPLYSSYLGFCNNGIGCDGFVTTLSVPKKQKQVTKAWMLANIKSHLKALDEETPNIGVALEAALSIVTPIMEKRKRV
jgi:Tfp pilus assembly protein PilZ